MNTHIVGGESQNGRKEIPKNFKEPVCSDDPRALINEGEYSVQAIRYEKDDYFNAKKLYIWFKVVDEGKCFGTNLFCVFNIPKEKISNGSKYYRAWTIANKGRRPVRNERMTPRIFLNRVFKVKVRNVVTDCKGRKHPEFLKYSIIDDILELIA